MSTSSTLSSILTGIVATGISSVAVSGDAQWSKHFNHAKKRLYSEVYPEKGRTFYAQCDWILDHKGKKRISLKSCGLDSQLDSKQYRSASQLHAEHVIPSSMGYKKNGQWRKCVIDAKNLNKNIRKYCRKNDPEFRRYHNDLNILQPSVGLINVDRSNKPFAERVSGENPTTYQGRTDITISSRTTIPHPSIRGDIARTYLYARDFYQIRLNKRQTDMFVRWAQQDPVSQQEYNRAKRIAKIQGQGNPYVLGQ